MKISNPYVHPDPANHMLNTVGDDGYSFDEKDDDEDMDDVKSVPKASPDSSEYTRRATRYANLSAEDAVRMTDKELCDIYDEDAAARDSADNGVPSL